MPRKPRVRGEKGIYHIIVRGNNQQDIFYDNLDRSFFLNRLKKYASELGIEVYSYCLMSNHVHLLVGNASDFMSKMIQKLLTSYVYMFNKKYNRSGHLFQGRFLSEPVENDMYFKTVVRYIHQNPEKTGLGKYDLYIWSSFQKIVQQKESEFVAVKKVLSYFGSARTFLKFHELSNEVCCMEYENKRLVSDTIAYELIKRLLAIDDLSVMNKMTVKQQRRYLQIIKSLNLPVRQISRITGINQFEIKNA